MTEEYPEGFDPDDPKNHAQFSFTRHRYSDGKRRWWITYRDVRMQITWLDDEESNAALVHLSRSLPAMLDVVHREMEIRESTDGLEKEIEELFSEQGGDE